MGGENPGELILIHLFPLTFFAPEAGMSEAFLVPLSQRERA
jgi:hypothetical protein